MKMKKKIILRHCKKKFAGFNFWLELIFSVLVVASIVADVGYKSSLDSLGNITSDIIIVLLPLVVTILSITLSMPREPIYGIENTDFRKLRGEKTYNFFDMMILTVLVFTVFGLATIFDFIITIWVLGFVSIVYSIIFLNQEIPILIRDDKKIKKIIGKNIHKNIKEITLESLPNEVSMLIALQNLLLTEGIISAYKVLESKNKERNRVYLDKLLSLQNEFLFGYIDNHTLVLESLSSQYKNIEILLAIDTAIRNINDIIGQNEQLNILEIYGDEEHFYHITRSLFSLHKILTELKFERKFTSEFSGIVVNIFMKIKFGKVNESSNKFLYKILNAMIINSVSKNELWFMEILRDSAFGDSFSVHGSDDYMVFVSIYFYYLSKLENRVPDELKKKIEDFINQPSKGINSSSETWSQVLKHKLNYMNPKDVSTLLTKMLLIFECNSNSFTWYEPSFHGAQWSTISGDHTFSKELIVNWWIGYVLTDSNLHAYAFNNKTTLIMPELNKNDAYLFAVELNKNWFEDDKLKTGVNLPIAGFYGINEKVESYMENSVLVNTLINFKNTQIKERIIKEIQDHPVTPDSLEKHKKVLVEGLKKAIQEFSVLDTSIDLSNAEKKYFGILFDTRWSEELVKSYAEKMPESLSRLIHDDFSKNDAVLKIKKQIKTYDVNTLKHILSFKPTSRYAYIHDFNYNGEERNLVEEISKIPMGKKLWVPRDIFLRNEAITANFEYDEVESFVRELTIDEINAIVDRDFKLVNGLYKYVEGVNGDKSILLNREELIKIVADKFFYARLVFKFKTVYKTEEILYFDIVKESK
jgi:hypothetical protein